MSSSGVCQGLQSCLEPRVMESRVLRLKLAPPVSLSQEKSSRTDEIYKRKDKDGDVGGWSFLQCLNKTEDSQAEKVYVHPTVKLSSSMLSSKSLEMCTEGLGCETGSNNAGENMDDIGLLSLESSTTCFERQTQQEASRNSVSRRMSRSGSFPPPLTSIRDMGGVRIRPHREDGRLILKAVATPSPHPYFEADRSNGRLRLHLFQTFISESDDEEEDEQEEEEEEEEEEEQVADEVQVCSEEDTEAEELEGNNEIVDDEMGKTKLARPRRCKESGNRNKGMPNWEPSFWVAT